MTSKSILKWVGFCLVIGGTAAHILIKMWFGPAYVSRQTRVALAEFWTGPVRVEDVDFHYDGVMHLRDIIFYDRAGMEVMKASGIELTLGNWPSLTAPAKRIEVDRLDVRLRLKKGIDKLGLPIQFGEGFNAEQSILEHFKIKQFGVSVESNETSFALSRMFIEINKSNDDYALYIGSSDKSGFQLGGKGHFNIKSSDMEMDLKFAQQAPPDEMKVLLSAEANISGPNQIAYDANVTAVDVNLAELTELTGAVKKLERETGFMRLEFSGKTPDLNDLKGRGVIFIEEADLWRVPVIGYLFARIGVLEESFGEMSDAVLKFRLAGTKLVIEQGRLSSSFSAIVAEKGGTIDLRSGRLDMHVVALPVKAIDRIMHRVPVIEWFVHFKNKLVRLRVKGQWSEPANKLISKRPLRDIGEGTVGFFMDVLESGGHIAEKLKQGLGPGKQNNGEN